jgi:hypothetical protein
MASPEGSDCRVLTFGGHAGAYVQGGGSAVSMCSPAYRVPRPVTLASFSISHSLWDRRDAPCLRLGGNVARIARRQENPRGTLRSQRRPGRVPKILQKGRRGGVMVCG